MGRKKRKIVVKKELDARVVLQRKQNSELNIECKRVLAEVKDLIDTVRDDIRSHEFPTTSVSCTFKILNPVDGKYLTNNKIEKVGDVGESVCGGENKVEKIKMAYRNPLGELTHSGKCTHVPVLEKIGKQFLKGESWLLIPMADKDGLCEAVASLEVALKMGPLFVSANHTGQLGRLVIVNQPITIYFPLDNNTVTSLTQHIFLFRDTLFELKSECDVYHVSLTTDPTYVESRGGQIYTWDHRVDYDDDTPPEFSTTNEVISISHSFRACKKFVRSWYELFKNIARHILSPMVSGKGEFNVILSAFYAENSPKNLNELDTILLDLLGALGMETFTIHPAVYLVEDNNLLVGDDKVSLDTILIIFKSVFTRENFFRINNLDAYSVSLCNIKLKN